MLIYLDEAGNSGCLTKNGKVSYRRDGQSLYVLAAVMPGSQEDDIMNRYRKFKEKHFPGGGEVKGNDLLTRRNNAVLDDFVEEFIGSCPVELCVYSKDFYLATAIMQSALGPDAKSTFPFYYYSEASDLALFGHKAIDAYAEYSNNPTEDAAERLVRHLLSDGAVREGGLLWTRLEKTANETSSSTVFDRGIVAGDYERPSYQNLVNLSAFGELMLAIKWDNGLSNESMEIAHDHILEFEGEYVSALREAGINLKLAFEDSSDSLGIQLADNMASVVFGAAKRALKAFRSRRPCSTDNEWALRLWSRLFFGIGPDKFKLVVPFQDQAFLHTAAEMYQDSFPEGYRNAFVFDELYMEWLRFVCSNQSDLVSEYDSQTVSNLMMR